jgi:hypothetical protein
MLRMGAPSVASMSPMRRYAALIGLLLSIISYLLVNPIHLP